MSIAAIIGGLVLASRVRAEDAGDEFSNNLFSDLAPLLTLFGERVTTQFMSQAMGWADNIILAMGPLGVITIIVSAIRVGGPSWLKAVVGRARENRAAAEGELMSSTSNEVCELWNGSKVVRVAGEAPIAEFICLMPLPKSAPDGSKGRQEDGTGPATISDAASIASSSLNNGLWESGPTFEVISLDKAVEKNYLELVKSRSLYRAVAGALASPLLALRRRNRTQHDDAENRARPLDDILAPKEPKFVIVRNKEPAAPNLLLNIDRYAGHAELWTVAVIGIILQLGVLINSGMITYFPTLMFEKENKPVADYAFPCTSAGTMLLICGLLICSHVVESSTVERHYRPVGMEARITYLQKPGTVNEQSFGSYSIFAKNPKSVITTSRPEEAGHVLENKTVIATIIGLCGFVIQFVGLRGMHWSATIVQLGVTLTMTVFRAFVRRDLANKPASRKLRPGFELDWFATTLALRFFPRGHDDITSTGDKKAPRRPARPSLSPQRDKVDPRTKAERNEKKGYPHNNDDAKRSLRGKDLDDAAEKFMANEAQNWIIDAINTSDDKATRASTAHHAMEIRKGLGDIAPWARPVSVEARAVAKAIEAMLNTLDGISAFSKTTSRASEHDELFVAASAADDDTALSDAGDLLKYTRSDSDETGEDTLSWRLDSREQGPIYFQAYRQANGRWKAPEGEIEAALSLWLYAVDFHTQSEPGHTGAFDSSGLNIRRSTTSRALWLLGANSASLRRDLCWWLPETSRIMVVGQIGNRFATSTIRDFDDCESDGLIGCAPKFCYSGWASPLTYKAKELRRPYDTISKYTCANTYLAAESEQPTSTLFAQHLFGSFMQALSKRLERPIKGGSSIQATNAEVLNNRSTSWQSFTLRNEHITRLARNIQNSGLCSLDDAYLCIIPALSSANRLPSMTSVVEWTHRHAVLSEQSGRRIDSGLAIDWLLATFPDDGPSGNLATSVAVAFLVSTAHLLKYWEQQRSLDSMSWVAVRGLRQAMSVKELSVVKLDLEAKLRETNRPGIPNLLAMYGELQTATISKAVMDVNLERKENLKAKYPDFVDHAMLDNNARRLNTTARDIHFRTALHYIIADEGVLVDDCLNAGANPDVQDVLGWAPLHYAVNHSHPWMTRELIRAGANLNIRSRDGSTPLHCAAMTGELRPMLELVNAGADPNALDGLRNTPLHLAALNGRSKVVQYLLPLTNRAICNGRTALHQTMLGEQKLSLREIFGSKLTGEAATARDDKGRMPLHYAAWAGREQAVISSLIGLMEGEDPKLDDSDRIRPSSYAARRGLDDLALQLFQHEGEDFEHRDEGERTLLHFAAQGNSAALIDNLAARWPQCLGGEEASKALYSAAKAGALQAGKTLIDCVSRGGPDALARMWALEPTRALVIKGAAGHGREEFLDMVLPERITEPGVWREIRSKNALHAATKWGHAGAVRRVLDRGCPVNEKDGRGRTALHHAARNGNKEIAEMLLSRAGGRRSLSVGDPRGSQPLAYAAWQGNLEMVRFLVFRGARVASQNAYGDTAFHLAAGGSTRLKHSRYRDEHRVQERVKVMQFLMTCGADPNARNWAGEEAKDLVKEDVYSFEDRRPMREPVITYLEDLQFGRAY